MGEWPSGQLFFAQASLGVACSGRVWPEKLQHALLLIIVAGLVVLTRSRTVPKVSPSASWIHPRLSPRSGSPFLARALALVAQLGASSSSLKLSPPLRVLGAEGQAGQVNICVYTSAAIGLVPVSRAFYAHLVSSDHP